MGLIFFHLTTVLKQLPSLRSWHGFNIGSDNLTRKDGSFSCKRVLILVEFWYFFFFCTKFFFWHISVFFYYNIKAVAPSSELGMVLVFVVILNTREQLPPRKELGIVLS